MGRVDAAGEGGRPCPADDELLLTGLNQFYVSRWRFWKSPHGYHAKRPGDFLQGSHDGAPVYALSDRNLAALWAMVQAQEDAPAGDAGDAGWEDDGPPARAPRCVHNACAARAGGPS